MKKAVQQIIEDWENEIIELRKIQEKNTPYSFHWSLAEGALGECRAILSDLRRVYGG